MVQIAHVLIESILDTGGARSLIDRATCEAVGLPIEVATKERHFGRYYGASTGDRFYYGRVPGPLEVRFSEDVMLCLPELKVIKH